MTENKNYVEKYETISEDIKYVSNSVIRLEILATLYERPQNIKELTDGIKLSYSSISSNIHGLELKDLVYLKSNRYCLTDSLRIIMEHFLELKDSANIVDDFYNIFEGHIVEGIPISSIHNMHQLKNANMLESGGVDAYRTYHFIEKSLKDTDNVHCVLPFYYVTFNKRLNDLVGGEKFVEALISKDVFSIYENKSEIKYSYPFDCDNSFLLIVSDDLMIFGLFNEDGFFDQNRLITSKDSDSIEWAKNLFRLFKKENII